MYMAVLVQREIEVMGSCAWLSRWSPPGGSPPAVFLLMMLVALLIASGVSLVGWVLARNLARPIQVLTSAAEKMEHGDLGVRVKPTGPQELHRLAEAFNSMANRLQSNVNELRAFVANASHELRTPTDRGQAARRSAARGRSGRRRRSPSAFWVRSRQRSTGWCAWSTTCWTYRAWKPGWIPASGRRSI